jgi:hypothetical protein
LAVFRSSQKIIRKLNLQLVSNIEKFATHTDLELGMLGIFGKLEKNGVHLWRGQGESDHTLVLTVKT